MKFILSFLGKAATTNIIKGSFIGLLVVVIAQVLISYTPVALGDFVDSSEFGANNSKFSNASFAIYLIVLTVGPLFREISEMVWFRVALRLVKDLRVSTFSNLLKKPIPFFLETPIGELTHAWNRGISATEGIVEIFAFRFLPQLCLLASSLTIISIEFSPLFALISMGFALLYMFWTAICTKLITKKQHLLITSENKFNERHIDYFTSIATIKSVKSEEFFANKVHDLSEDVRKHNAGMIDLQTLWDVGNRILYVLTIASFILFAFTFFTEEISTKGQIISLIGMTSFVLSPAQSIADFYNSLKMDQVRQQDLIRYLETENSPIFNTSDEWKELELKIGVFSYDGKNSLLSNTGLQLNRGMWVGLRGDSGIGKSSIAKILAGYYLNDNISLELDGYSAQLAPPTIGVVMQNQEFIKASISDNIIFGREPISSSLKRAFSAACLTDEFQVNDETFLLETNGTNISGGQKQRIAIARALYSEPSLLILDEATSGLPIELEYQIFSQIRNQYPNMSVLLISHRKKSLENCGIVYTLKNQELVSMSTLN